MSSPTVRQLQTKLYRQARSAAQELTAGDNSAIISYSRKFEQSLPRRFKKINREDFFAGIVDADIILYGDFHTLKQSQKGFVRLLEELAVFNPSRPRLIAMEAFQANQQEALELLQQQKITEQEFLRRIDYEKTWGFPWRNYQRIVNYALAEKIPIFGINSTRTKGKDKLAQRDRFCAEKLTQLARKFSQHQILCITGEYHLADQQLPATLSHSLQKTKLKYKKVVRVVANIDQYYFTLNFPSEFTISHYLYLKKNLYCLMDTPPWVKWHSYTFWEEQRNDSVQLDSRERLYNEIMIDLDYHILSLVSDLVKFFKFPSNPAILTLFNLVSGAPEKIIRQAQQQKLVLPQDLKTVAVRLALDEFFYVNKSKTILLTRVSLNNLAEAAGQFLYDTVARADFKKTAVNNFYQRVIRFALGILCSKIINPKRKLTNYYRYVDIAQDKERVELEQRGIAREIVRFHSWMLHRVEHCDGRIVRHLSRTVAMDEQVAFEISKALGKIIGVKIYRQTIKHCTPTAEIRALFQPQPSMRNPWHVVVDMYRCFLEHTDNSSGSQKS